MASATERMDPKDIATAIKTLMDLTYEYEASKTDADRAMWARAGFTLARKILPELMFLLQNMAMPTWINQVQDLDGTPQGLMLYYDSDDPWKRLHEFAEAMQHTQF
jgi:hypothetical protein